MFSHVQEGENVYDYDGTVFTQSKRVPCVKITKSPFQNPVIVPLDGFEVL